MSRAGKSGEALVDEFVRYLNHAGFERRFRDEVPVELRTEELDGMVRWQVRPIATNPWVQELVQKLPHPLPGIYRSLVSRYRFCNFEIGPMMFFANSGHNLSFELVTSVFKDPSFFPTLHKHGYLEFGEAFGGNYDPICFDTERGRGGDAPVVQLDHEEILIRNRIRVVQEIAPSLSNFLRRAIAEKLAIR